MTTDVSVGQLRCLSVTAAKEDFKFDEECYGNEHVLNSLRTLFLSLRGPFLSL